MINSANLTLVLIIVFLINFIISAIAKRDRYFFTSSACLLTLAGSPQTLGLTNSWLGISLVWSIVLFITVITMLYFKLSPLKIYNFVGKNVLFLMGAIAFSLITSYWSLFPFKTLRVTLSFALVLFVGWNIIGRSLARHPNEIYNNIRAMLYGLAFVGIIKAGLNLAILRWSFLYDSTCPENTVYLGSISIVRFQGINNAVTLGYIMLFSFLVLVNVSIKAKSFFFRMLLVALSVIMLSLTLLTGSRGPIITLYIIIAGLLFFTIASSQNRPITRAFSGFLLLLLVSVSIIYMNKLAMPYLTARNQTDSLTAEAYQSRFKMAFEIIDAAKEFGYNPFLGAGVGANYAIHDICRIRALKSKKPYYPRPIESFFIGVIFEWGIFGGVLYCMGMLALTIAVIRMEYLRRLSGERTAWIATVWMIIPWISFPISYGHSIPNGDLILAIAMGVSSMAYLRYSRFRKIHKFSG